MPFRIDDSAISERLRSIREAVGAREAEYRPNRFQIVDEIIPASEVESLFGSGGLLVRDNRPVFAYIRDHTEKSLAEWGGPQAMKKLHFAVCGTLLEMKAKGRFDRFRVTNATGDRYTVDVREGEREVPLYPCQNCLNEVGYRCFSYKHTPPARRSEIVREFNARATMDMLWQWFDLFRQEVLGLRSAYSPTGYAGNWRRRARAFKQHAGWKCESCGVCLSRARNLLDVHHVNGDKRNNSDDNLRCLCKECHSKEHGHYRVSKDDLRTIEQARKQCPLT